MIDRSFNASNTLRIKFDSLSSKWGVFSASDGVFLHITGTHKAAQVQRKRIQASKDVRPRLCPSTLPSAPPWSISNGQSDGILLDLMSVDREAFYGVMA